MGVTLFPPYSFFLFSLVLIFVPVGVSTTIFIWYLSLFVVCPCLAASVLCSVGTYCQKTDFQVVTLQEE